MGEYILQWSGLILILDSGPIIGRIQGTMWGAEGIQPELAVEKARALPSVLYRINWASFSLKIKLIYLHLMVDSFLHIDLKASYSSTFLLYY